MHKLCCCVWWLQVSSGWSMTRQQNWCALANVFCSLDMVALSSSLVILFVFVTVMNTDEQMTVINDIHSKYFHCLTFNYWLSHWAWLLGIFWPPRIFSECQPRFACLFLCVRSDFLGTSFECLSICTQLTNITGTCFVILETISDRHGVIFANWLL